MTKISKCHALLLLFPLVSWTDGATAASYIFGSSGDFYRATVFCEQLGMRLPVPKSKEKNEELVYFLQSFRLHNRVWLGLKLPHNSDHPDDFLWEDNDPISWTNWADFEPNHMDTSKCVSMGINGRWYTRRCLYTELTVCQTPTFINTPTPAASPTPANGIKPTVCSSSDQPHEAHFRRVHGYHPSGTPLTVINSSILLRCASECLRHTDCDVIILSGSWSCSLHAFSVWNTSEALTYTHKAYKKICSG